MSKCKPHKCKLPPILIAIALAISVNPLTTLAQAEPIQSTNRVIRVPLRNENMAAPGHGFTQVFLLSENDEIYYKQVPYKIVRPKLKRDVPLAYFWIYFLGAKGIIEKNITVLVADYQSETPRFFVDSNNNLDFSDDPLQKPEKSDQRFVVSIHNPKNGARFRIRLVSFSVPGTISDQLKDQAKHLFSGYLKMMGGEYADTKYWYTNQRLNNSTSTIEIDGHSVLLGLHDYDCNGHYADPRDRLVFGTSDRQSISPQRADGAVAAKKDELFLIGKTPFRIVDLATDGSWISLAKSSKMPDRLFVGSRIPDFQLTRFDDSSHSLWDLQEPSKYLLLDFWGHWCGPCVAAIPKTVEFHEEWKNKVTLVGIHNGEKEQAQKLIEQHQIPWHQYEFTEELEEKLFVDRWPTYTLINPAGEIISFNSSLSSIKERLSQLETTEANQKTK